MQQWSQLLIKAINMQPQTHKKLCGEKAENIALSSVYKIAQTWTMYDLQTRLTNLD